MPQSFDQRCIRLLSELGLARPDEVGEIRPLTGGVASDIGVVSVPGREIVVKFALEKLKVDADWRAPVHRNKAEYAWLEFAHATCPANAPALFGWSPGMQGFAMEFLSGGEVFSWKAALLAGTAPAGIAAKVGAVLGRLHAVSSAPGFDRGAFRNRDDFRAIRLEPYLSFTAGRHPDVAERLTGLAEALYEADPVLVHGDVSPKNILVRDGEPILLDAECATMGDASFDLAFCLNHLVLKAVHLPQQRQDLLDQALAFWAAYAPQVIWEAPGELEARSMALLPALMLGRIDGKSPVEYLAQDNRARVRRLSLPLIAAPVATLAEFIDTLRKELETT